MIISDRSIALLGVASLSAFGLVHLSSAAIAKGTYAAITESANPKVSPPWHAPSGPPHKQKDGTYYFLPVSHTPPDPTDAPFYTARAKIDKLAESLSSSDDYDATVNKSGKVVQTQCSKYVRDLAHAVFGHTLPELDGDAATQIDQMSQSDNFTEITGEVPNKLEEAERAAEGGNFVVAGWVNPSPQAGNSGHVAEILGDGTKNSKAWAPTGVPSVPVPYVSDARDSGGVAKESIAEAFSAKKMNTVRYFVYTP